MFFKALYEGEQECDFSKSAIKSGRKFGVITLTESHLFFRKGFTKYFISYDNIERAFRRVYQVPAKIRKENVNIPVERLVLMKNNAEIAEIGLPGIAKAKEIMDILKAKCPNASFDIPSEEKADE